jgi:hypothetical protein
MKNTLNRRANAFSNFESFENYTGQGDDLIEFVGSVVNFSSVFEPHNSDSRTFTINITVGTNFAKSGIQLFGDLWSGAEDSSYSDIAAATLDTGLTVSSSPKSIRKLYSWLQANPTILQGFQIVCSNPAVISSIISTHETSPFRDLATEPINLSAYINPYMFNDKMVLVQGLNKVISHQSYWLLPCAAAAAAYTITINLYFGAALNLSKALENKMKRAAVGIQNLGGVVVGRFVGGETPANSGTVNLNVDSSNINNGLEVVRVPAGTRYELTRVE